MVLVLFQKNSPWASGASRRGAHLVGFWPNRPIKDLKVHIKNLQDSKSENPSKTYRKSVIWASSGLPGGPFGGFWGVLEASWGHLGASWRRVGDILGHLGGILGHLRGFLLKNIEKTMKYMGFLRFLAIGEGGRGMRPMALGDRFRAREY